MRWFGLALMCLIPAAHSLADPGTAFGFQGQLKSQSAPISGTVSLQFTLHDADMSGNQIGLAVIKDDIFISEGYVATELDFGEVFDGTKLWLEISLDPDGTNPGETYQILNPRVQLYPAPYAITARTAHGDSDKDATNEFNSSISMNGSTLSVVDAGGELTLDLSPTTSDLGDGNSLDSSDGLLTDIVTVDVSGNVDVDLSNSSGIDQSNEWIGISNGATELQTFTAGRSGLLTAVEIRKANSGNGSTTVKIYEGEGTGGALLVSESGNLPGTGWAKHVFSNPPMVEAGSIYTMHFADKNYFIYISEDLYSGGETLDLFQNDMVFRTYVSPGYLGVRGDSTLHGNLTSQDTLFASSAIVETRLFIGSDSPGVDEHGIFQKTDGPGQGWHRLDDNDGASDDAAWYETSIASPSDQRLKTDIAPIPDALKKIRQLNGISFNWNQAGLDRITSAVDAFVAGPNSSIHDDLELRKTLKEEAAVALSASQLGLIAQEVHQIAPELVYERSDGYLEVAYEQLIPLLVEGIREETGRLSTLDSVISELEQTLASENSAMVSRSETLEKRQREIDRLRAMITRMESNSREVAK